MEKISLPRSMEDDFTFEGILLAQVDDKGLATTPNWWQISVYQDTNNSFVFSSTFWRNYPRSLPSIHRVLIFQKLDEMYTYLIEGCCMPEKFADNLLQKTKKALDLVANPLEPLYIPVNRSQDSVEEEDELEYYDPIFVEDQDDMDNAMYQHIDRVTGEEFISSYL